MGTSDRPVTRPAITTLGEVTTVGNTTTIHGWTLGLCANRCTCHYGVGPERPIYLISGGTDAGYLGLRSFAQDGKCNCCAPWTVDELVAVIRDMAEITGLITTEPSTETP